MKQVSASSATAPSAIDISFCLPIYNVADFIKPCIESIIAQNLENISYEILCIDDGSKDNSVDVIKNLSLEYSQIRLISNSENKGVSYTRNKAIEYAKGKYIWYVDGDDMLYPNCAKDMLLSLQKHQGDVIIGDFIKSDEDAVLENFKENKSVNITVVSTYGEDFYPCDSSGFPMNSVCTAIFSRDFLMRNKLLFNEKMIAQEDTLFYYEFSQNTDVVIRYNQPCYIYRQRLTSVMHSKSDERSVKYYRSMQEMYDVYATYLKSGNYKNEELLCKKIHHMKQNLAFMLALISDTGFVKSELKALKSNKLYPYKLRIQALKGKEPFLRRVMTFCLPIEPVFWVLHQLYKKHIK